MSLFSLANQQTTEQASSKSSIVHQVGNCLPIRSKQVLAQVIGKLEKEQTIHFMSRGEWSMHDLLEHVLRQTGAANVWLTTWALTEEPVRKLFFLKEEGLLQSLSCIVDYRLRVRKPEPLQLLEGIAARIAFTQCHAKVSIIENADWSVSIVGSANYTKNPRIEAGTICSSKQVARFHKEWIKAITHGSESTTTTGNGGTISGVLPP